jgi:hypothetical protein
VPVECPDFEGKICNVNGMAQCSKQCKATPGGAVRVRRWAGLHTVRRGLGVGGWAIQGDTGEWCGGGRVVAGLIPDAAGLGRLGFRGVL